MTKEHFGSDINSAASKELRELTPVRKLLRRGAAVGATGLAAFGIANLGAESQDSANEAGIGEIICHNSQTVAAHEGDSWGQLIAGNVELGNIDEADFQNRLVGGIASRQSAIADNETFIIPVGTVTNHKHINAGVEYALPKSCDIPQQLP